MKRLPLTLSLICALCFAVADLPAADPKETKTPARHVLRAATDRADALYRRGETVTFTVRLQDDGKPAESGEVEWTLTKDGVAPARSGKAKMERGQATITGTLEEAGFLQCRATFQSGATKLTALAGAGISPLEIKPSALAPDDFDGFWAAQKKALSAVPMNARLTAVKSAREGVDAFDLQADCIGAPVSGYFARPAGAKPRSLPAILTVHGAGVHGSTLATAVGWAKEGSLAMDINAHGLPNGRDNAYYESQAAGELKNYRAIGLESRETVYFLGMFLRLMRALDFLAAQPEWDGRTLVVSGSSQGGYQAIVAAGLDSRVSFFAAGVPAGCDHTGSLVGRIAGWPKFIATNEKGTPEVIAAMRYFDCVNFAARTKSPAIFTVGFIDTTCPPTSVYAAYNALRGPKDIFNDITAGHTNTPAAGCSRAAWSAASSASLLLFDLSL